MSWPVCPVCGRPPHSPGTKLTDTSRPRYFLADGRKHQTAAQGRGPNRVHVLSCMVAGITDLNAESFHADIVDTTEAEGRRWQPARLPMLSDCHDSPCNMLDSCCCTVVLMRSRLLHAAQQHGDRGSIQYGPAHRQSTHRSPEFPFGCPSGRFPCPFLRGAHQRACDLHRYLGGVRDLPGERGMDVSHVNCHVAIPFCR